LISSTLRLLATLHLPLGRTCGYHQLEGHGHQPWPGRTAIKVAFRHQSGNITAYGACGGRIAMRSAPFAGHFYHGTYVDSSEHCRNYTVYILYNRYYFQRQIHRMENPVGDCHPFVSASGCNRIYSTG